MQCMLGFISEMSLRKSAIKVKDLYTFEPGSRVAMPDYGNMSGLIRLIDKRKGNVIPAVTLRLVQSYDMRNKAYEKIRLFAYDKQAYIRLCELITTASEHTHYESRIEVEHVAKVVKETPNLFGIIDEECIAYDRFFDKEHVFIAVNAQSNLDQKIYYTRKPIFFNETVALHKKDYSVIELMSNVEINEQEDYFDNPKHYIKASFVPESLKNYEFLMQHEYDKNMIVFENKLPIFADNDIALFESLVWSGFAERYPNPTQEHKDRLNYEIDVIKRMGFPSYFLIVWDFIDWAKRHQIAIGPGRGSAAGSIVAYCLGITQLCPIEHELYFERFLNPDRISMPDIDVDVSQARRDEVIKYLEHKYGKDRVCQIVALSLLKSKVAFKDACRINGISNDEANTVTKAWPPSKFGVIPKLEAAYQFDTVKAWANSHPEVWKQAQLMEDFVRQWQVHAAGVVIAPSKVTDYAPVMSQDNTRMCQYDKNDSEKYGLLKMDLLGLKNLDILQHAASWIGMDFTDLYKMKLDDPKVYERFREGDTHGVFQFESRGMQKILRRIKPDKFGDLSSATALYRPGPLQAGLAEMYINNKNSTTKVTPFIPEFETLLADTYMTFVYQEQIMRIAREIAGFTMSKADTLRKAIGKKDKKMMGSLKEEFVNGAIERGQEPAKMDKLWRDIEGFGDYCFNKSHSAAYSLISYYCMWFKVYHPQAFIVALLSADMGDSKKLSSHFLHFCKDVTFEYPKMNKCEVGYSTQPDGSLMLGLGSIKDIGNAKDFIGKFENIGDFLQNTPVDRTKLVQLIKAGFFDDVEPDRDALMGNVDMMLASAKNLKVSKRNFLFSFQGSDDVHLDYSKRKTLNKAKSEFEAFGFNIKEGFIAKHAHIVEVMPDDCLVGIVAKIKRTKTKKDGKDMALVEVYSNNGTFNLMMFPNTFEKYNTILFEEHAYIFKYTISEANERFDETWIVQDMMSCDEFKPKSITLYDPNGYNEGMLEYIPVTSSGDIEVIYEGDSTASMKTETIGYINILNDEFLNKLPRTLELNVQVF